MAMHCAGVNKRLGCVAGIADAGHDGPLIGWNYIIFSTEGGIITTIKGTRGILHKNTSRVIGFRRVGIVYRMDAWLAREEVVGKQPLFQVHGK